ncbi:DNA polymerase III subunit chi [Rivibacter subsaxonicus]|uniref:DNA polymerase III chi subunit n=1 Tax=Rivibacter subsaxonicus TaxID=457575 RepID=A0A4Q7VE85_9BURK|nr:DNA polymerase III subunit chi [Rivibacter subsaxonicus]RZT93863.1 DNA polymerase III chi subunit [Rivibacter subsaxonicus]
MTEVTFHTGVGDRLAYACRLLRKAQRGGARIAVTGEASSLAELDRALWSFDPLAFVAHVRLPAGAQPTPAQRAATPIWLVEHAADAPAVPVLVNLGPEVAVGFESFERLIEVVGDAAEERLAGRQRWKHYADRGYTLLHHDRAGAAGQPDRGG